MSEWNYVIGAYVLTWIGILGYGIRLARRLRRAANDLTNASSGGPEAGA